MSDTTLLLYTEQAPSGSCLLLARAIAEVSPLSGKECLYIADSLFNSQFSHNQPLALAVKEGADVRHLKRLCEEYYIIITVG